MHKALLLALVAVFLLGEAALAMNKVEATSDTIRLVFSMSKDQYLDGEPIPVRLGLVNTNPSSRHLAEPDWNFSSLVHFDIDQVSGSEPLTAKEDGSTIALMPDYGSDFQPGQIRNGEYNLQNDLGQRLPVGRYRVRAIYRVPQHVKVDWHGELATPVLTFSVVQAPANLAAVAQVFKDLSLVGGNQKAASGLAKTYHVLATPDTGGPFAPYARYYEGVAYAVAGQDDESLEAFRRYVKEHGDVPYFGLRAGWRVAQALYAKKDLRSAREAALALPDSYFQRDFLRRIGKELAPGASDQGSAE